MSTSEALELSASLGDILRKKGLTVASAESCTGGMIAHLVTAVAGSSDYFKGSVVSYANEVKINVLGVSGEAILQHGAVSEPVVRQMAEGVRRLMNVDIAVATSGVAGPGGGSAEKPVGTVWMAVSTQQSTFARCFHFGTDRLENINSAAVAALQWLKDIAETLNH